MAYTLTPTIRELSDEDMSALRDAIQQETDRRLTIAVAAQQVTQVAKSLLAAGGDLSTLTAAVELVQATTDGGVA